jgi:Zn-dependent metalloprotease
VAHSHICSIIPPHIFKNIAEHGDEQQRAAARHMLEQSAEVRGERKAFGLMTGALSLGTGEKRRTIYDGQGKKDLPGKLIRGEGSKATKDVAANEAYDGSGITYDLYKTVYGRNSIDGKGLRLDATVHFGTNYSNAQWNGRQMLYGDGDGKLFNRFTSALDIIGHELTHGVTQYTAGLEYHDQSGALNESFSDVFGILVKQFKLKQTAAKSDWLIGVGLFTKAVHGVAVRSMKAPGTAYSDKVVGTDPQPSHMSKYDKRAEDSGGVHINSGIPNHAFYLVATALGGNAWEIPGKIWYDALTRRLKHDSNFQACADATYQAAGDLFGIGAAPQHAVAEAWKNVGVPVSAAILLDGPHIPVLPKRMPSFSVPSAAAELPDMIAVATPRARSARK